jgi:hypothetical protein
MRPFPPDRTLVTKRSRKRESVYLCWLTANLGDGKREEKIKLGFHFVHVRETILFRNDAFQQREMKDKEKVRKERMGVLDW